MQDSLTTNTLSLFLATLCVALAYAYFALLKKYKLVRYLFIQTSDWNSEMIDELVNCANELVRDTTKHIVADGLESNFENEVHERTPFVISNAKAEWTKQKDSFQQTLIQNNVAPLTMHDYTSVLLKTTSKYKLD